jgi:hypothetical protein
MDMLGIEQELSDALAQDGPARLAHLDHFLARGSQTGCQCGGQGRLATAITAFQRNISVNRGTIRCH